MDSVYKVFAVETVVWDHVESVQKLQEDFVELMNPDSITVKHGYVEPALAAAKPGDKFQFMRIGYFCTDLDHTSEHPVFNRAVGLKDSFKM